MKEKHSLSQTVTFITLSMIFLLTGSVPLYAQVSDHQIYKRWKSNDKNNDNIVTRDEFTGRPELFDRLDLNSDDKITEIEIRAFIKRLSRLKDQRFAGGERHIERPPDLPGNCEFHGNIEYALVNDRALLLDIYHLKNPPSKSMPVVVWIHGGGWRGGSRLSGYKRLEKLVQDGYCGVQVDYRLSGEAKWPAQIHDCKAAIRFLRAHADEYNIDPDRICVWGSSAGGHLVSMLGTSWDIAELEGDLGWNEFSSRPNAVCTWAGPSDFSGILEIEGEEGVHGGKNSTLELLFGEPPLEIPDKLKQASPVTYASGDDPPFLIMNGAKDTLVHPSQGEILHKALQKAGAESEFYLLENEKHGINIRKHGNSVLEFFNRVIGKG